MIHCAYPDRVADQGKNWVQDRFYYGLAPSLRDALEFTMVELPEREQAGASFDKLYTLAKKMEACQPNCKHWGQGSSDVYQDRYRKYPAPRGWVATLTEEEFLPPDPEPLDLGVPELDVIQGLSLRMTQAMNHYQREECWCFMCGVTDQFAWDCPHRDSIHLWWREQLNFQGGGSQPKEPIKPSTDVSAHVAMMHDTPSMIASESMAHWVGPDTLVGLWVQGREVNALADSGSQVNTVMPNYVCRYEFPMLPLCDLVNHPLNLVGLGGTRTHQLGFVILRVQVKKIARYDEDMVFLVVLDKSEFARHVSIVVGTCTLGRIVNMIKEGEMDRLSTPWVVVRASNLLSQRCTVAEDQGVAGDGPVEHGAMASQFPVG